jgi:branched-chain amino acid transport system ATP-binding protein
MLEIEELHGGYGEVDILNGVDLALEEGQITVIIGPNGAGKSTLMKAVFGLLQVRGGRISLDGREITNMRPYRIARLGLGYVPQEANTFPSMTVEENLEIGAFLMSEGREQSRQRIFELFPPLARLRRRVAGTMSGGERQMLAMGRALMTRPRLLLLDEPTAALSPRYVDETFAYIQAIRASGITVLMVEQNAMQALAVADRGAVMVMGEVRLSDRAPEILANREVAEMYLGRRAGG